MDVGLTVGCFLVYYLIAGFMLAGVVHFSAVVFAVFRSFVLDALKGR